MRLRTIFPVAAAAVVAVAAVSAGPSGAEPITPVGERTVAGDTWQSVATRLNVDVDDLQALNNVDPSTANNVSPGVVRRALWVPSATLPPATTTTPTPTTTQAPATTAAPTTTTAPTTTAAPATTAAPTTTAPATTTTTVPSGATFFEAFATAAGFYDRFDYGISGFHPNVDPNALQSWEGDHEMSTMNCGGAATSRTVHLDHDAPNDPTSRSLNDISEMFYWCAPGGADTGHIMTAFEPLGYAYLWFAPKQTFTNVTKVCWDQNQTMLGGRKWTQMSISSLSDVNREQAENGYLDLGWSHPGFRDPNGPSTHVLPSWDAHTSSHIDDEGTFAVSTSFYSPFGVFHPYVGATDLTSNGIGGWGGKTEDVAARRRSCVSDDRAGTLTFVNTDNVGVQHTSTLAGSFPDGQVRVAFQDANYDPPKDGEYDPDQNTWHWDNIEIS